MKKQNKNKNLGTAKTVKNDEFYTQLTDINNELGYYKKYFKNKTVFCNCDDPKESNFWNYFALNFDFLGLKKLISTHFETMKPSYKLEIEKDINGDGRIDEQDAIKTILIQNGDFRSPECIELLKEADIVVTNPPFSLFREYVAQLIEYKKDFIIIGNINAITYKDIFKLIKQDKIWFGATCFNGGATYFVAPKELYDSQKMSSEKNGYMKEGKFYWRVNGVRWYTNLDHKKRHEDLILYKKYIKKSYPKYDNYNAINVDKVKDIPCDYRGSMGVPISFMDKYNPEQFEIIGLGISNSGIEIGVKPYKKQHKKYRKEIQKRGAVDGDLYMIKKGVVDVPYARIIIKKKIKEDKVL